MKTFLFMIFVISLTGCSSNSIDFYSYRQQVDMCRSMGMDVYVRKAVSRGDVFVKGVSCRDEYGAMWPVERM